MNSLQLVLKQMRQRALSSWLTLLSVTLGVGLAIAIMVFQRGADELFAQADFGFDIIVGPKASALQLVLNTVYPPLVKLDRFAGFWSPIAARFLYLNV